MAWQDAIKNLNPWTQIQKLQNQLTEMKSQRPISRPLMPSSHVVVPQYPYPLELLEKFARSSDIITIIHNALRGEIFRNGYEIVEKVKVDSDFLFSHPPTETASDNVIDAERFKIMQFFARCNSNGQTIVDVFKELEDDYNTYDNAWQLFLFNYDYGVTGAETKRVLIETLRIDPKTMAKIMNLQDIPGMDDEGHWLLSCPQDRHKTFKFREWDPENPPVHPRFGCPMYPVYFKHVGNTGIETFYFEWEIVHRSRYRPSKRLGYSPIATIYMKLMILFSQDEYMLDLYKGKRPPKGLLLAKTSNREGLLASWRELIELVKEFPHMPGLLAVPGGGSSGESGKFAEFFDFMRSMEEMQFVEFRKELREQAGAVYGVSPIFTNDTSTSGGLNNDGMQITVTNRSVELKQNDYNEVHFPRTLHALGCQYHVTRLKPSEEQDEMAKLERQKMSLENAVSAVNAGLQVEWDEDKSEAVIHSGILEKALLPPMFGETEDGGSEDSSLSGSDSGSPDDDTDDQSGRPENVEKGAASDFMKSLKGLLDTFVKTYKRKPSRKELEKSLEKVKDLFRSRMQSTTVRHVRRLYDEGVQEVEKDLGFNIPFGQVDEQAISYLSNSPVLQKSFSGLQRKVSEEIMGIIDEAYNDPSGLSANALTKRMRDLADLTDHRAETIARTESSKVSSAARRISYQKEDREDTFRYQWIGPDDDRTTDTSKRIKSRTKSGVSWNELVQVITEESKKANPSWTVDLNAPVSHPNSRHTFIRVQ